MPDKMDFILSLIHISMVQQVTFTLESSQQLMLQSLVSSDVLWHCLLYTSDTLSKGLDYNNDAVIKLGEKDVTDYFTPSYDATAKTLTLDVYKRQDRDTMEQERIAIDELDAYFAKKFEF